MTIIFIIFVFSPYRNELEEFCQGLKHYKLLDLIRMHVLSFRCVFVHGESVQEPVCANYIINTFTPQFSDFGTNRREKEEDIYELWVSFVRGISGYTINYYLLSSNSPFFSIFHFQECYLEFKRLYLVYLVYYFIDLYNHQNLSWTNPFNKLYLNKITCLVILITTNKEGAVA